MLNLGTTTTGKRRDAIPPGGKENSSPFDRWPEETLERVELPFSELLAGSGFISESFLTFFS